MTGAGAEVFAGAVAEASEYGFSGTIFPRTNEELTKIRIPEHEYRSDIDFFMVTVMPVLKHPALAYYERLAPILKEYLSKSNQLKIDRGYCNALKSLIKEGVVEWDDIIPEVNSRVKSFTLFEIGYSARVT